MPELIGLELTKNLKLLPAYKTVPMIVVTIDKFKNRDKKASKRELVAALSSPSKAKRYYQR